MPVLAGSPTPLISPRHLFLAHSAQAPPASLLFFALIRHLCPGTSVRAVSSVGKFFCGILATSHPLISSSPSGLGGRLPSATRSWITPCRMADCQPSPSPALFLSREMSPAEHVTCSTFVVHGLPPHSAHRGEGVCLFCPPCVPRTYSH